MYWRIGILYSCLLFIPVIGNSAESESFSSFKDCEECPEMVVLPLGSFMMGATPQEANHPFIGSVPAELPRHEVTIGYRFAIGMYEVKVAEFDAFAKETGTGSGGTCMIRLAEKGKLALKYEGTKHPDSDLAAASPYIVYISDGSYSQPGLPVDADQPAVCISRNEMKAYLEWLSSKTGRGYRLPTEAEWEYAVRAGTDAIAFWGDNFAKTCEFANFADKSSGYQAGIAAPCREKIKPVWTANAGSYGPNPWGIHDMSGNVQEMIEDCWHESYLGAPTDGSPWREDDCQLFVARGGDYELMHISMRASERLFAGYVPEDPGSRIEGEDAGHTSRANVLGFRVAVSLDDTAWDKK